MHLLHGQLGDQLVATLHGKERDFLPLWSCSGTREVGEIGQKLSHTFHVVNEGPWPAEEVTLHIDWPYQAEGGAEQGKWLQYLTEAVELSPPGIGRCFLSPKRVNSLGLRERRPPPSLPPGPSRRGSRGHGGRGGVLGSTVARRSTI